VHVLDILAGCLVALVVVLLATLLARQRYLLSVVGGVPLAMRVRGDRWAYGVARYAGGELRWYRGLGIGTRPTRVLRRNELSVLTHRAPVHAEMSSLPAAAIIVRCRHGEGTATLGLSAGAFTGFVSWLQAAAPTA
jgi:Protein of unknown function (DUF2550)